VQLCSIGVTVWLVPCRILKLRQIGTHGVHLRDFPSLAGLFGQHKRIFSFPGWSSQSGIREYFPSQAGLASLVQENIFFPWLVWPVWYNRIFSFPGWSSQSADKTISSLLAETIPLPLLLHRQRGGSVRMSLYISSMVKLQPLLKVVST
jgi:hypothetical protein